MKKLIIKLLYVVLFLPNGLTQTINLTGYVKTQSGENVEGALVYLVNNTSVTAYTAVDGTFTLSGTFTGVNKNIEQQNTISIDNGVLKIKYQQGPVTVGFYDLNGRQLNTYYQNRISSGYYEFDVSAFTSTYSGLLIIRVILGPEVYCFKYLPGNQTRYFLKPDIGNSTLKNTAAAIDTLITVHSSLGIKKTAVENYTADLGVIFLDQIMAMDYSFSGGTLDDLIAACPSLTFNTLDINGKLKIPSGKKVIINANNVTVNDNIEVEYPPCAPYGNGPEITFNVTGNISINSLINLYGHLGKDQLSSATCNSCYGRNGGNLDISAKNIYLYDGIHVYGGGGGSIVIADVKCGCSGGDGGNVSLKAQGELKIYPSSVRINTEGGFGGYGALECTDGEEGKWGKVNFEGSSIIINEVTGDYNMSVDQAQVVDYEPSVIKGNVRFKEEFDHRGNGGTYYVTFSGGVGITLYDWLEDLYLLYLDAESIVKLKLDVENADADLDLYLLSSDMTQIIAQSTGGPGVVESICTNALPAGYYIIAVSYDDRGENLSSNYSIKLKNPMPGGNLLAWYPLNGNANDMSNNSRNGTNYGAIATTDRYGNTSGAMLFDGVDDYIDLPDISELGPELTISAWVNVKSVKTWSRLIEYGGGEFVNNIIVTLSTTNTGKPGLLACSGTCNSVEIPSAIPLNTWQHIAFTLSGNTGTCYLNGVNVGTAPINTTHDAVLRTFNYIGRSDFAADEYAHAAFDNIRVYTRVLAQDEIDALIEE